MNIFSLRDKDPEELLKKLDKKGWKAVNSRGNDYLKGKWNKFLKNAKFLNVNSIIHELFSFLFYQMF